MRVCRGGIQKAGVREPGLCVMPYVYTPGSTTLAFVRVPSGKPRRRLVRKTTVGAGSRGPKLASQTKIHCRPSG